MGKEDLKGEQSKAAEKKESKVSHLPESLKDKFSYDQPYKVVVWTGGEVNLANLTEDSALDLVKRGFPDLTKL